jgi:transcriptional regulator
MLLQTLATLGPLHGYAIAARLEQVSGGVLRVNMGTLYPGLMRLEQRGLVRAEWNITDTNRKARFYTVTAAGRRQLAAEKAEWDRMTAIMQPGRSGPRAGAATTPGARRRGCAAPRPDAGGRTAGIPN